MSEVECEQLGPVKGPTAVKNETPEAKTFFHSEIPSEYAKYAEYLLNRKFNMQNM